MAFRLGDRARETSTAPGTGSFTVNGAVQGAQSLASVLTANADTSWYFATNGTSWEVGVLTRTSATVYARATPFASSNAGALVNFSTGLVDIALDLPAWVLDHLNLIEASLASAATTDLGSIQGKCIQLTGTTGPTSFGTGKNKERLVRYTGAGLTITNSATLVCPGGANLTLATDDIFYAVSDNTATPIWRILWRIPAGGKIYLPVDGSAALPALTWASDPDTGFYRIGANNFGAAVNGAKVLDVSGSGLASPSFIVPATQPNTTWAVDGSATVFTAANGGNLSIGGSGGVFVICNPNTGNMAIYMVAAGGVSMIVSSSGGEFIAPTTTPGAGKSSVAYDGASAYRIYNNSGSSAGYHVCGMRVL